MIIQLKLFFSWLVDFGFSKEFIEDIQDDDDDTEGSFVMALKTVDICGTDWIFLMFFKNVYCWCWGLEFTSIKFASSFV